MKYYLAPMSGDTNTLFKMKDLWTYMIRSFENSEKNLKKIRKAGSIPEYKVVVDAVFRDGILDHIT